MFYGYEVTGNIRPISKEYKGINSPNELYDVLMKIFSRDTCTTRLRHIWSKDNPTCGQCSITALLVQDIFGGKVYEMDSPGGSIHSFNEVNGIVFDLTSEQFGDKVSELDYSLVSIQDRNMRLKNKEKLERYELLKRLVKEYCNQ
ncbi:MAG: hypothetical protein HUJ56_10670 [Erysipelotrichaceae bacterium]|nr:hypothetical protein [Erysipelotrichaceae bacterium]